MSDETGVVRDQWAGRQAAADDREFLKHFVCAIRRCDAIIATAHSGSVMVWRKNADATVIPDVAT